MTSNWDELSPQARNLAYNNVEHVGPDIARQKTDEWSQISHDMRARYPNHLDLPYAGRERTKWDLYPAENPEAPCMVHIHGGYWQRGSKEIFACLTQGLQAHGWSAALPGYSLAPGATLTEIVVELRQALSWLEQNAASHGIRGPVILTGWSAGGHLTSLLLDHPVCHAGLAISGVFDLAHLRDSPHVNDKLNLTENEVRSLSPMRLPMAEKPLTVSYGGAELPAMIKSSRQYQRRRSEAQLWGDLVPIPGANHFTILDQLRDPESHLVKSVLALAA
ncbi:alpha/beta hydrolase [Aestuariivirga sp.]|uniref:alpha/beta hydrolase n=1 Tax=Aestuariivirga sp. TaxID=2650926 RepID=UPI003BA8D1FB